jgi:hypothetical protein
MASPSSIRLVEKLVSCVSLDSLTNSPLLCPNTEELEIKKKRFNVFGSFIRF